jgi:polysaccharide export outer membrane protein
MIFTLFWILAGFLLTNGCSSVNPAQPLDKKPLAGIEKSDNGSAVFAADPQETSDLERLARLSQTRRQEGLGGDFPIGPGDVLQVSVTGMDELKDLTVRVLGDGTISLPFVGLVNAAGVTDRALREEIRRRLQTNYMHDPHVSLFVKEFRSRQVAVVGAVSRPGLYSLASSADTIFDMISLAGGMNAQAAERIVLIPADPAEPEKAKAIVASLPAQVVSEDPSPLIMKSVDPIVINLNILKRGGNERYLGLLARPGDVIMIPGAGDVLLQGWIEKPGSYKITPGLTLLGVVAAAGGTTFPADTGSVKIIRTNKHGEKTFFVANLESIERGEERDLSLQEGDVIDVSSSSPKLVAYGFYRFFSTIFRIGAHASIPLVR